MKALVLSGGKGSRLRPLTYTGAKQLVPVGGRPILFYILDNIAKAGIKDVGMIISPETGEEVRNAVGDGDRWGINITYILQESPAGLAHAVRAGRDFLRDSPFIMYLGDNLIGSGIMGIIDEFNRKMPDALILLKEVDEPRSFGIATVNGERIIRLEEKPDVPQSNLALVGIYIFSPSIHRAIDEIRPSKRGELEITDAIQRLIDTDGDVISHRLEGWWLDTGKKDDLLTANAVVLDEWGRRDIKGEVDKDSSIFGRVSIGKGARIIHSTIRGPAFIGDDAIIEDAFIGPYTSIGDGSRIIKSAIENSVIMQGSFVSHLERLEDCLIGRRVRVEKNMKSHKALRLNLGDDSVVEV